MKKLIIRVVGVLFLVGFLIYLFYSPRLKFDVLENPNKGNKVNRSEQVNKSNNHAENPKPKEGVGTWVGKDIKVLTSKFGQADRVYPFRDGYKNYVFKDKNSYYIVSTKREEIVSVQKFLIIQVLIQNLPLKLMVKNMNLNFQMKI